MPVPFNYLPWLNALLCLGMGLYVLSRNWRKWANVGFFVGMAALGMTELGRIAGAGEILLAGSPRSTCGRCSCSSPSSSCWRSSSPTPSRSG